MIEISTGTARLAFVNRHSRGKGGVSYWQVYFKL